MLWREAVAGTHGSRKRGIWCLFKGGWLPHDVAQQQVQIQRALNRKLKCAHGTRLCGRRPTLGGAPERRRLQGHVAQRYVAHLLPACGRNVEGLAR